MLRHFHRGAPQRRQPRRGRGKGAHAHGHRHKPPRRQDRGILRPRFQPQVFRLRPSRSDRRGRRKRRALRFLQRAQERDDMPGLRSAKTAQQVCRRYLSDQGRSQADKKVPAEKVRRRGRAQEEGLFHGGARRVDKRRDRRGVPRVLRQDAARRRVPLRRV